MRSLTRALTRRCPRCGHRPVFVSFFRMTESCGGCELRFEREPGYWVGAMTINTVVVVALFLGTFAGGAILTWPDVPWRWVLGVTVAINLVVPLVFYPVAKVLWIAIDLSFQRVDGGR